MTGRIATLALLGSLAFAGSPSAGPLGLGLPSLPNVNGALGPVTNRTLGTVNQDANVVRDAVGRPNQPRMIEKDSNGFRVVRGEVLALSPSEKSLGIARALDFEVLHRDELSALGMNVLVLRTPDGMSASGALEALREADPQGVYDVAHIYDPTGSSASGGASLSAAPEGVQRSAVRIGMIDGGIERRHDAFEGAKIVTHDCVPASTIATKHGTAVASLLIGSDSNVTGALPGATLYAADVYCGQAMGGSADAIARALGWLAGEDVAVVNISLAGPPNAILAAVVASFVKRGHVLVAAVGNDGPAAGVEYPAGYAGVVGVTAVDPKHDVELEANRGSDVAFAAEGIDVDVAALNDRHDTMTGTSFAAPVVAARFALLVWRPDPQAALRAWNMLERAAIHLGPPGRNDIFGYGLLDRPPSLQGATAQK